jgi:hypothetical protein
MRPLLLYGFAGAGRRPKIGLQKRMRCITEFFAERDNLPRSIAPTRDRRLN